MTQVDLHLKVLGPMTVELAGQEIEIGGPRLRSLLALLAARRGAPVSTDGIITALWGAPVDSDARGTVQVGISRLRKIIGAEAIVTRPSGYVLNVGPDALDAARFEKAARTWTAPGIPARDVEGHLEAALGEWRGSAYEGFSSLSWARSEAVRLDELKATVEESLAEARLRLGLYEMILPDLTALVDAHPLREKPRGLLMLALYRSGRHAEALRAFASLRKQMVETLGVEPGERLRQLEAAILRQDPDLLRDDRLYSGERAPAAARRSRRADRGPFIGRDGEHALLRRAWSEATRGEGGIVAVTGPPGIGKTRLLAEAAAEVDRGFVLWGRCFEGLWTTPYSAFREGLADLPPDMAGDLLRELGPARRAALGALVPAWGIEVQPLTLGPRERRELTLDSIRALLIRLADIHPVFLALDDLHWADRGTAELLSASVSAVSGARLLIVGSCRSTELPEHVPMTRALRVLAREPRFVQVDLHGMGPEAVAELAGTLGNGPPSAELAASLHLRTGGNPYLITEMVRSGGTDASGALPAPIRALIVDRVSRLGAQAQQLVRAAAICEHPFSLHVAGAVAGLDQDTALLAADQAGEAGLLLPDATAELHRFDHQLTREALLAELAPARRAHLHRRWAEVLAARPGSDPTEVALHYQASASLDGAEAGADFALAAASAAQATGAHDQAVVAFDAALALLAPTDPRRQSVLAELPRALAWALQPERAAEIGIAVVDRLAARSGADGALEYAADIAVTLSTSGAEEPAAAVARHGLTFASGQATLAAAQLTIIDLDHQDAHNPASPGIMIDRPERRNAARVIAACLAGEPALHPYSEVLSMAFDSREQILAYPSEYPGLLGFWAGEYRRAIQLLAVLAPAVEERGELAWAATCRNNLGRCQRALGEFGPADHSLGLARTLAERAGNSPGTTLNLLAARDERCLALDEGWDELLASAEGIERSGPVNQWAMAAFMAAAARIYARLGDTATSLAHLEAVIDPLIQASGASINYTRMACDAAGTLWELNRTDHHSTIAEMVMEKVVRPDFRYPMFDGRLSMARLHALAGRFDDAATWFDASRRVLDQAGARPLRAIVDHDQALMLVRSRSPRYLGEARRYASEACRRFRELGMTRWEERAAELADHRARPARASQAQGIRRR